MRQTISIAFIQLLAVFAILVMDQWPDRLLIFGFDIPYLLVAEWRELKGFYPNFYWLIYALARLFKLSIVVIASLIIFVGLTGLKTRKAKGLRSLTEDADKLVLLILLPFVVTLVLIVSSYCLLEGQLNSWEQFQRSLAQSFIVVNVFNLLVTRLRFNELIDSLVNRFLIIRTWPHALAITRILFFGYSLFIYKGFESKYGSLIGTLDKAGLPGIGWLIELLPVNPMIYGLTCYAGIIFAFMVVIGYRTRVFLLLNAVTIFYVLATPNFYGKLWHYQIVIWISWILAASPSDSRSC